MNRKTQCDISLMLLFWKIAGVALNNSAFNFKFLFVMPHLNCICLAYRAKKAPDPNAPLPPLPFHLHPPQKREMKKERSGLGVLSF